MKGKQALTDIGIVLVIPVLVFLGYYFWNSGSDSELLSLVAPQEGQQEYGKEAKAALAELKSITMDGSLFEDPVYKSLQEFHVDVSPAVLGRSYPFSTPDAVLKVTKSRPHI